MVFRNHGLLTCGPSVPEAFNLMYQLEMACRAQVDMMTAGALVSLDEETIAYAANLYQPGTRRPYGVLEWPALLRQLKYESKNSGYPAYDA